MWNKVSEMGTPKEPGRYEVKLKPNDNIYEASVRIGEIRIDGEKFFHNIDAVLIDADEWRKL